MQGIANVEVTVNLVPEVDAGADQIIVLPASASLDATVNDDGLPDPPGVVTTLWSTVSGPGGVTFTDANAIDTTATFSAPGEYVLRLTADDGLQSVDDDVAVTVDPAPNMPPVVDAGADQPVTLPDAANLDATVTDDGLPSGTVTTAWSVDSGPGTVTFGDLGAVDTTADFSVAGTYVLRLTADDGLLSSSDVVTITVSDIPPPNAAPVVNAGDDQTITLPAQAGLAGVVSDDGLPNPPGVTTTEWTVVSGPGSVTFGDSSAVVTDATFSQDGVYVLRLTADDSVLNTSDDVQITVDPAASVCPAGAIDFTQFALESYSNQDVSGGASASGDGSSVTLTGNAWKRSIQSYTVTPNTVIEFEYASTSQGEIHGIGFDADQTLNNDPRLFQFWGTQNWTGTGAIDYSPKYDGSGAFQSYAIPVGNYYSGSGFRLVFVNDKDSGDARQ